MSAAGTVVGEAFSRSVRERVARAGISLARSTDSLGALCRGLEDAAAEAGSTTRLYTCLPTVALSADRRRRYRELARQAALVAVWAAPADLEAAAELAAEAGDRLRIAPVESGGPSAGSWFVVVNGPGDAVVLLADVEEPSAGGQTLLRATLSTDPDLVSEIEARLREQLGLPPADAAPGPAGDRARPAALERLVDALSRELDDALTGHRGLLRERGEVSRLIAHDLKGPLGFITGMAELMLMDRYGELPEEVRDHLTEMIRQGDRAVELLDQVALTHRLEAGDLRVRRGEVDARQIVEQAAALTAAEATEYGRRVVVRPGGEPVSASLDRRLVERAIAILISEVLRQGTGDGDVIVGLDRPGRELLVDVRRERSSTELAGEPPAPAADDARTAPARAALDLRFCALVAQAHGGSLAVESGVGGVASCRIALPVD